MHSGFVSRMGRPPENLGLKHSSMMDEYRNRQFKDDDNEYSDQDSDVDLEEDQDESYQEDYKDNDDENKKDRKQGGNVQSQVGLYNYIKFIYNSRKY